MVTIALYANRKRNTDVQNRILDSVGKGEGGMFRENSIETCILSRVKQITSPGWMLGPSALERPRGMGWRGRWEGFGVGNTCKSMVDSSQCITKTTTIFCKVISLQLKKKWKKKCWLWYILERKIGEMEIWKLPLLFYLQSKVSDLIHSRANKYSIINWWWFSH